MALITRSPGCVVVMEGAAAVVEAALPEPCAPSSVPVVASPLHSVTFAAAVLAAESVAVTLPTAGAPRRYQVSTRVFEPDRNPAAPFVHVAPDESTTLATVTEPPALTAILATSAWPATEVTGNANEVAPLTLPVVCFTSEIAGGGLAPDVVAVAVLLAPDTFPDASRARTWYA